MLKYTDLFNIKKIFRDIIDITEVKTICDMISKIGDEKERDVLYAFLTLPLRDAFNIGYKTSVSILFDKSEKQTYELNKTVVQEFKENLFKYINDEQKKEFEKLFPVTQNKVFEYGYQTALSLNVPDSIS